jgi:iron complex outermembrane receptor protein
MTFQSPMLQSRILHRSVIAALLGGLCFEPLLAQQVENDATLTLAPVTLGGDGSAETDGYALPSNRTAAGMDVAVKEIPQAVVSVAPQALTDRAVTTLDEALATVSGVTQTNTLAGKDDAIIRRGFGAGRDGSILTDGLKTAIPHSFNATVDQVDVLKGPASVLYGILDPGGMINVITKKPGATPGTRLYTRFDAYGAGRNSTTAGIDTTGPISGTNLSYRLIAEGENGDYWRNFGERKQWLVAPSLSWSDEVTTITASLMHQDYELPYERGTIYDSTAGRFIDIDRRTRLDEPFARTTGKTDLARISAEHRFDNGWKLTFGAAWSRDRSDADQVRVTAYNSATGIATRRTDLRDHYTLKTVSARSDLTGEATLGGLRHEFLFGMSIDNEDTDRSQLQSCGNTRINVFNPTYGSASACVYDASSDAGEYETIRTHSFYMQDRVHFTNQLIGVAGLRLQDYDITAGRGTAQNTDTSGTELLPNLGLVWNIAPEFALYASASKSFRPMASGLSATLAVYTADKENVAFAETVNNETVYRTAGLVRSKGIELDLAGQITDRLQVIASFGYTDALVKEDAEYAGKRLPNVAARTAALYLSYDHGEVFDGAGDLRYGGGLRTVSSRSGDSDNSYDLPGYGLVDVFAAYTFQSKNPVKVQLNINNLLDKTYYTSSIGNSAYGILVGEPRNASLSISLAF